MKNKGNAKSDYSKNQILVSLIDNMRNQEFEKISIKEIVDQAEVSRKTFYRNFDSKIEVLVLEVDAIVAAYISRINEATNLSFETVVLLVFSTAEEHALFIELLVRNNLLYLLTDRLYEEILLIYEKKKAEIFEQFGEMTIANTLLFSFGGFEKYIKQWIKETPRKTPLQVQEDFKRIIELFIKSSEGA
ncbi:MULTISPECIES: TetR/AcrR family transcriptional regulator [Enterococcus]|uniref:HTH tetR-type domain-containing protein n=1 Tax=Candidatus Enterococcus ferrettii TaxID=2815324 RepID=A0ABV0EJU5_9ENTE|nr:TetR/AcrR family transcriptional regulator [Enterococcus sp. 665A]MBO1338252.1 TetR/AcrR family transcriptional regulator [Enterococcus sp. 665A]